MPHPDRDRLASIRTFPQLVAYLRDELDWPIDSDDIEEVTYEYTPEELGIDPRNAAKIEGIRQLMPLTAGQTWGIFFIKFEKKRLPVVALRRVLGQLVVRKRAGANKTERAAWALNDLLFISSYGEDTNRRITFAHFHEDQRWGDLPVLNVLGWHGDDTALNLDHVASELKNKLRWPEGSESPDNWRHRWSSAFALRHREVIATADAMASRLAQLARSIRDRAKAALAIETPRGPMRTLMAGFQRALIHDLTEDDFADMYAQTIAYGLLTARVSRPEGLVADDVAELIPVTNPFLKEMLETFIRLGGRQKKGAGGPAFDFDELGVNDVVQTLREANMPAVLRSFGAKNPQEDPVIHFYEDFLKEYDAKKRMQRGVFYTPRPVVSYIVRSVDELLRTEFGLEDGLADTATWGDMKARHADLKLPDRIKPTDRFVTILDPATGTGTFLVEVIGVIHRTMVAKWRKQGHADKKITELWNDYVPKHLLPRLHGYELLMAPYAIAHLKIGLKLHETGYHFGSEERARIYLTNALEPAHDHSGLLDFAIPALAHEAKEVNGVKRERRFTVVLGNPPYSGHSRNKGDWIQSLMRGGNRQSPANYFECGGLPLNEKQPKWLNDDYVKFIRLAQWQIDATGMGAVGFITNHGFLDNPTFRGMRESLMESFPESRYLDLHGNSKKRESTPDGGKDENVFDIKQGVAVAILKRGGTDRKRVVLHADLFGSREAKYATLAKEDAIATAWEPLTPAGPFSLFVPRNVDLQAEYSGFWKLTDIMPCNAVGVVTGRDQFAINFDRDPLLDRVTAFCDRGKSDDQVRALFNIRDAGGYVLARRRPLVKGGNPAEFIRDVLYRPFDKRFIAYSRGFLTADQFAIMRHMLAGRNVGLISARSNKSGSPDHFFCTRDIMETKCGESTTQSAFFPLFLVDDQKFMGRAVQATTFCPNVSDGLAAALERCSGRAFDPSEWFSYLYAVVFSPAYRERYAEFLKTDFPRIPLPGSRALFDALVPLGERLVSLHLMEAEVNRAAVFSGKGTGEVGKVAYDDARQAVHINPAQSFAPVPPEVWEFHIGGYQVCHKWLKDRKGRTLSPDDIEHYRYIVAALAETIELMARIDDVIDEHGGWPDAFAAPTTGDPK